MNFNTKMLNVRHALWQSNQILGKIYFDSIYLHFLNAKQRLSIIIKYDLAIKGNRTERNISQMVANQTMKGIKSRSAISRMCRVAYPILNIEYMAPTSDLINIYF